MESGTTTVRIRSKSLTRLRELSRTKGQSMPALLERAINELVEKEFWADVHAADAALMADPDAWAEELAERKVWEATLMDGLEEE
jgi:predicted transcriptional regulator